MAKDYVKYYAPGVLFFLVLLDGQLSRFFLNWTNGSYAATAHLFIIALMCCCLTVSKQVMIVATIILGIIFDIYYLGFIGVYAVAFPLLAFVMYQMTSVNNRNIFTMFFASVIFVTMYELITVSIQLVFKIITVNPTMFITRVLGPTLLLNIVIFIIFIWPFKKLFVVE